MKKSLLTGWPGAVAAALGVALLALFFSTGQATAQPQVLRRQVPATVANLPPVGRLPGTNRLTLALSLPLRNPEALEGLLRELYEPASPRFRHYLTAAEFTERFGPRRSDYQALIDFAQAQGLAIVGTHLNRVVLDLSGPVAEIEKAFHVTLRVYQHPKEGRTFYAPDTDPTVDLSVPIMDVQGLDNYWLPQPKLKPKPAGGANATPRAGSGPSGSYRGNDFRAAYVPGTSLNGAGQNVGLLQFDGYYPNDITTYASQTGLPNPNLVNVPVNGGVSSPGNNNAEVALDIEMVMSMAPGASTIYVYEAPNGTAWTTILNKMATDNLAKQLSCSWGGGSPNATAENIFKQMAAQGQSFFNATGDSDAFTNSIPFPSDSTNITQVGGTTLSTTGPGGAYVSETVWNWGNGTGSSGGISTYYGIPSYQLGLSMSANQGSTTMRNVPDVALTGDNVYVVYNNGSAGIFGGTSCAAPLWAGLTALINQQAAANGSSPVGFLNPTLYTIGKGGNYTANFHDITSGNNYSSSSPSKFAAASGYDLCTGWGTPKGPTLINTLAGVPMPNVVSNSLALVSETCANGVVDPGETVTLSFGLLNSGSASTTNLVATLLVTNGVSSPSSPQAYGALAALGGTAVRPFTFTANGNCGDTLTATLQLQDGTVNLGSVSFTIPLGQLNTGVVFAEAFDSVATPTLPAGWTTAASGGQSPWGTSSAASDSAPNAAFSAEAATAGVNELVTPSIFISSASAQLSFRHSYNLQQSKNGRSINANDGGVLEIQLGGGVFTDILTAGGSFVAGGYNRTINSSSNPLNTRQCWSGNSGGFITTTVNLPAAAAGQTIQLKWRCGTDSSTSGSGWYVDTVSLTDSYFACCSPGADLAVSQSASATSVVVGNNLTYTLSITNAGVQPAGGVQVTDKLPAGVAFVSASPGCSYSAGQVTGALGTLANGAATNLSVLVQVLAAGSLTNALTVSGSGETNLANNTSTLVTTALAAPHLSITPTALNFGSVAVGQSVTQNWALVNTGQATLSGSASTQPPFAVVGGSPYAINGGQTGWVAVAFSPSAASNYTGNLVFASNGGNSTNALSGAGAYPPVASFSATPTSGSFPLTVTFTDSSTGTLTNRTFDFGDGLSATLTATTVQHTYSGAGTNTVILTVRGPLGTATQTRAGYILVTNAPVADLALGLAAAGEPVGRSNQFAYTLSVTNLGPATASGILVTSTLPASVEFVSADSGGSNWGAQVVWQLTALEVGARSNLSLVVIPTALGTLTNVASVSSGTADTNTANNVVALVTTVVGPPSAAFLLAPASGLAPLRVTFSDTSTGVVTNRFWDFGDGATSNTTATALTHLYSPGTNTVRLVVAGPGGASTNGQTATSWLDSIGDGVPDWWRAAYFGVGDSTNSLSCATCDPDGDGLDNLAEFLADTNPTNSGSALKITGVSAVPGGVRVDWQGGMAAWQLVQSRSSLLSSNGGWVDVFTNLPPTPLDNRFTSGISTNGVQFFRVKAFRQ